MSNLYNTIEKLCREKGVTITQMCTAAEVSRGGLSDLKAGRSKNLSASSISKISEYFGVTADYLLSGGTSSIEKGSLSEKKLCEDLQKIENLLRSKPEAEQKVLIEAIFKFLG